MTGYANNEPVPRDKPHWYRFDESYCPLCARTQTERTRMAGKRPKRWEDRYFIEEHFDWCDW